MQGQVQWVPLILFINGGVAVLIAIAALAGGWWSILLCGLVAIAIGFACIADFGVKK